MLEFSWHASTLEVNPRSAQDCGWRSAIRAKVGTNARVRESRHHECCPRPRRLKSVTKDRPFSSCGFSGVEACRGCCPTRSSQRRRHRISVCQHAFDSDIGHRSLEGLLEGPRVHPALLFRATANETQRALWHSLWRIASGEGAYRKCVGRRQMRPALALRRTV